MLHPLLGQGALLQNDRSGLFAYSLQAHSVGDAIAEHVHIGLILTDKISLGRRLRSPAGSLLPVARHEFRSA